MKKLTFLLTCLIFFSIHPTVSVTAEDVGSLNAPSILVQLDPSGTINDLIPENTTYQTISEPLDIYQLFLASEAHERNTITALKASPYVKHVTENDKVTVSNTGSDLQTVQQHYFNFIDHTDVKATTAPTIAILDTGIDPTLQEMSDFILPGYNAINESNNVQDDNDHGTVVASIMRSIITTNNYQGLSEHIRLLPIQVAEDDGFIYKASILKGIQYAMDQDVDVINMSYSGTAYNPIEEELLQAAKDQGITLVAASGNEGVKGIGFPARYASTIAVGSVTVPDEYDTGLMDTHDLPLSRAYFSNYGHHLSLTAPGELLISHQNETDFVQVTGTSFSAPFVSVLAALLTSTYDDITPNEIERLITEGATYYDTRWNDAIGYGAVNFSRTLNLDRPDQSTDLPDQLSASRLLNTNETITDQFQLSYDEDWLQLDIKYDAFDTLIKINNLADITEVSVDILDAEGNVLYEDLTDSVHALPLREGQYNVKITETFGRWSDADYTITTYQQLYQDVTPTSSHYLGTTYLSEEGVLNGYTSETAPPVFKVNDDISRSQVAAIFQRLLALPVPTTRESILENYTDVKPTDYYAEAISAVIDSGIITGYQTSNDTWYYNQGPLSREQMASVLVRALNLTPKDKETAINLKNVSPTHRESVQILADYGLTDQLEDFRPKAPVTRGQFSSFLYRALTDQDT